MLIFRKLTATAKNLAATAASFANITTVAIAAVALLLAGCATRTHVGPTCASCKPYCEKGRWYRPQLYYEYDEIGIASWYGNEFHGRPKATREPFDKMLMTAAHKTLPLPTVARVTCLRNGRSVIVVIDDRGPFYNGRIIDLSYGAARALGTWRRPEPVRVQALPAESLKLSLYIARYCPRRRDPYGRSWVQLYFQEICGYGRRRR